MRAHARSGSLGTAVLCGACAAGLVACDDSANARAQIVLVIDTDAPTVGQGIDDPALSPAALVDTLSIVPLDGALGPIASDERTLVLSELSDWPISLGIVPEAGAPVRLRMRLYRAGQVAENDETLRAVAIDRVVELEAAGDGIVQRRVVLSLACMGKLPNLLNETTCVDAERRAEPFRSGLEETSGAGSVAGTSVFAREAPCKAAAPPGAVCIPGGLTLLGDAATYGLDDDEIAPSFPLRPVWVSPFFLDRDEMSLERFATLDLKDVPAPGTEPACTSGKGDPKLPVSCVPLETATAACAALAGRLPTEAEWEHAARGRGQARAHPWGDEFPSCCSTRIECQSGAACLAECGSVGPAAVGSHDAASGCPGPVDVSRDGVRDLAGNVAELTRGVVEPYDHPCFGEPGLVENPECDVPGIAPSLRGGSFADSFLFAYAAIRRGAPSGALGITTGQTGFRCAYPDGP